MKEHAEQQLRRHRALAGASRARILAELGDDETLDARSLAARVGLHVNTVRAHLTVLKDAGLVSSETVPPEGRGRPRLVYQTTAAAPREESRRYRLLAEILATLVARSGREATPQLEEIGEAWGHYMVDAPPPYATLSEDDTVDRLVALLARLGFEPELEQARRAQRITMRSCPFLELARRHQDVVCPIHLGLMRGALAGLGATKVRTSLEPFVRPELCVARLVSRRPTG